MGSLAFAQANSIGSSGAIFGLLGALLVCLWNAKPKAQIVELLEFSISVSAPLPIYLLDSESSNTINSTANRCMGHFGGLLGGLFISILLSNIKYSYKVGSLIVLFCLGVPLFNQLPIPTLMGYKDINSASRT